MRARHNTFFDWMMIDTEYCDYPFYSKDNLKEHEKKYNVSIDRFISVEEESTGSNYTNSGYVIWITTDGRFGLDTISRNFYPADEGRDNYFFHLGLFDSKEALDKEALQPLSSFL